MRVRTGRGRKARESVIVAIIFSSPATFRTVKMRVALQLLPWSNVSAVAFIDLSLSFTDSLIATLAPTSASLEFTSASMWSCVLALPLWGAVESGRLGKGAIGVVASCLTTSSNGDDHGELLGCICRRASVDTVFWAWSRHTLWITIAFSFEAGEKLVE